MRWSTPRWRPRLGRTRKVRGYVGTEVMSLDGRVLDPLRQEWKGTRRVPEDTLSFVVNWVVAHSTAIDRPFGEFVAVVNRCDGLAGAPAARCQPSEAAAARPGGY